MHHVGCLWKMWGLNIYCPSPPCGEYLCTSAGPPNTGDEGEYCPPLLGESAPVPAPDGVYCAAAACGE